MRNRDLWLSILLLIAAGLLAGAPLAAQEETAEPDTPPVIEFGEVVGDRLNSTIPSARYTFEALRGDYLSLRLSVTGGNLDPVLALIDPNGQVVVQRDDSGGRLDVLVRPLLITESGWYTLVVARFGYGLGSTSGTYEVLVERIGNSSEYGSAMRYGDTVLNAITNEQPAIYYTFRGNQGDIVNLTMRRETGDLDPFLQVIDGEFRLIAEADDDIDGSLDARIEALLLPVTGTYYVAATRYGQDAGTSTGNFTLTLEEAANSGLGNTPRAAIPISLGDTVEAEIDGERWQRYYRFEAQQDDIITVRMTRTSGFLDPWVEIANAGLQVIAFDDDSGGNRNALIEEFRIPASGTYYLIATRYEKEAGGSTGRYTLALEDLGNAFAAVPPDVQRIGYGLSLTGSIDEVTPEGRYAFWGEEGDIINVTMSRVDGDLNPQITLLDANGAVLIGDATSPNARITTYTLPRTGVYTLVAGRSDTTSRGNYILVLTSRDTATEGG